MYPTNGKWGWVILNPFRPDGPVFSVSPVRYAITRFGILTLDSGVTAEPCLHSFASVLAGARGESRLSLETGHIQVGSHAEADQLIQLAAQLAKSEPQRRAKKLGKVLAKTFDVERVEDVCAALQRHASPLRAVSMCLFLVCFVLFPILLAAVGLHVSLVFIIPAVLLLSAVTAILYQRAVRVLMPLTPRIDIYGNMAKFIFYPISALRSVDLISYRLLSAYDPIAVSAVLCGENTAARLAIKEMAALRYGAVRAETEDSVSSAIKDYRQARYSAVLAFCSQQSIPISDWDSQPTAEDGACMTYCPSCGIQYTIHEGICDCNNIVLQTMKSGAAEKAMSTGSEPAND